MIRRAGREDAEALAALGRTTFLETFVEGFGIPYPPEDLRAFLDRAYEVAKLRACLDDPREAWWIAERAGALVAYANAGPNTLPHPKGDPGHAELRRLYVARAAQGSGLGRALLEEALGWMAAHTTGPLWLGVWSGNLKAQRLYAAYGFEKVGEYKYQVGAWFDDELIFARP